jgi:hypothetical protein
MSGWGAPSYATSHVYVVSPRGAVGSCVEGSMLSLRNSERGSLRLTAFFVRIVVVAV